MQWFYLWIHQERETRPTFDDICNFYSLRLCHKSENWKDDDCRKERSERVDAANYDWIPINIVMKSVVWSKCQKGSDAYSVGEKDLSTSINPAFAHLQSFPIWSEQEFQATHGTRKCQCLDAKDTKQYVRRNRRYPNDLRQDLNNSNYMRIYGNR